MEFIQKPEQPEKMYQRAAKRLAEIAINGNPFRIMIASLSVKSGKLRGLILDEIRGITKRKNPDLKRFKKVLKGSEGRGRLVL